MAKVALVVGGYVGAFIAASAVVAMHVAATSGDRQGSDGMYAFGDSLFFLAAFSVAGVPATGAALYFLRPYGRFWRVLSVAALGIAATGVAAVVVYVAVRSSGERSTLSTLAMLSPLRVLLAPPLGLAFLLAGVFAPGRSSRTALLAAAVAEAAVVVYMGLIWSRGFHP